MNAFPLPAAAANWQNAEQQRGGVGVGLKEGSCHIYHYAGFLIAQVRTLHTVWRAVPHAFCPLPACVCTWACLCMSVRAYACTAVMLS